MTLLIVAAGDILLLVPVQMIKQRPDACFMTLEDPSYTINGGWGGHPAARVQAVPELPQGKRW